MSSSQWYVFSQYTIHKARHLPKFFFRECVAHQGISIYKEYRLTRRGLLQLRLRREPFNTTMFKACTFVFVSNLYFYSVEHPHFNGETTSFYCKRDVWGICVHGVVVINCLAC